MHPIFDRRDLTAMRERDRQALGHAEPADDTGEQLLALNRQLERLLTQERAEITQLCVTDREPAEYCMENFPVPGTKRLIVRRTGAGGSFVLAANVPLEILQPNENRLGGRIVNAGANPVTLFLAADLAGTGGSPLSEGIAQVVVPAGASWDMKLGDLLWAGSITALSVLGTTVSVAEV